MLSGFELYSRWVPLIFIVEILYNLSTRNVYPEQ